MPAYTGISPIRIRQDTVVSTKINILPFIYIKTMLFPQVLIGTLNNTGLEYSISAFSKR